jgi:integrase
MSRRAAGEGSILKRADGRWAGYVTLPSGGRRYFYGKTQQEVVRRIAEARRALKSGLPLPSERLTVAAYLHDWLIAVKRTLKPRTWVRYEQYVRVHAVPVIGGIPLARL